MLPLPTLRGWPGNVRTALLPRTQPQPLPQPEPAVTRPAHVPALDGVRGLAILLVLIAHGFGAGLVPHTAVERVLDGVANWGWIGVDLFFVLSGFLITTILLTTRQKAHYLRNFFARRILRIFPLYYATILTCLVLLPLLCSAARFDGLRDLSGHQAWFWLHLSNYYRITCNDPPMGWMSCLWSLAVEEHFYLVWPFVVWKLSSGRLLRLSLGLAAVALGLRIALALAGVSGEYLYRSTLTRFDPLLLGACLALVARQPGGLARLTSLARFVVPAALVVLLAQMLACGGADGRRSTFHGMTGQYSVVGLLFAGLLVLVLTAPRTGAFQRVFTWRPLLVLGKYSYALYILNKPAYLLLQEFLVPSHWLLAGSQIPAAVAFVLAGILLTFVGSQLTWRLLEKPCLDLKRYFEAPANPAAPPGPANHEVAPLQTACHPEPLAALHCAATTPS
jgi:peptidoglycan/LPS O-acetylase OafA/YrhL